VRTFTIKVEQIVEVTLDETKFDDKFMQEFQRSMYHFTSLEEHAEHLGQLYARGLYDNGSFIEGYGPAADMGIRFEDTDQWEEIIGVS
jgi:hypothetical protein